MFSLNSSAKKYFKMKGDLRIAAWLIRTAILCIHNPHPLGMRYF